jgi:deferrochelatase/peroxidase EfeB
VRRRLTVADRGPGWSYRPDAAPPSIYGEHQTGIATPQLDRVALAGFDLDGDPRELLAAWSATAEELMSPELTVTLGLGPGVFDGSLRDRRPAALAELPAFEGDQLDPALSGGDACVLVGASDAGAAAAALERMAGAAALRWRQDGFVHRSRGSVARDLLGFRDGVDNLRRGRDLDRHVWAGTGDRSWMTGGTYLVVRRIRIALDAWNAVPDDEQEQVIGRHKRSGVALGARALFDGPPLAGSAIAADAHIRLAAPRTNGGAAMLRRSYSYDNGPRDAGLLFLAFARDPRRQYVPVQRRLAEGDALSRFTTHVGSAVFAIPPGARPDGFIAEGLFAPG